jgi:hypothetical protein
MVVNFKQADPVQLQTLKPGEEFEYRGIQYVRLRFPLNEDYISTSIGHIVSMCKKDFIVVSLPESTEVRPINTGKNRKKCTVEDIKLGEAFQFSDKEGSEVFMKICGTYTNRHGREVTEIYGVRLVTGGTSPLSDSDVVYPVEAKVTVE